MKFKKNLSIIFLISLTTIILVNQQVNSQNILRINNDVISYCYQPLSSSLGLHQIYAININGTNNRKVINATIGLNHHDWSSDTMKFTTVGYIGNGNTWSIFTFKSDGTNLVRLTTTNYVWDTEPVWSRDMTKIAFTRLYYDMKNELWIMNADGSNQHYIGVEGYASRWSNDCTKFVYYAKKTLSNNYELYICDTNGTNEQRLTNTPIDEMYPIFSPDGTEIAYCAGTDGILNDWEIYKMKSNGTEIRKITNNNSYDGYPKWSPDGTMFAYESDLHQTEKWEVYLMDTSGANIQRLTYSPANFTSIKPVWRPSIITNIHKVGNTTPKDNKLYQNYPNPFNPSTIIRYSVLNSGFVNIKLYNMLGKEITTLVNAYQKRGLYDVTLNMNELNLTSGLYFYTFSVNESNYNQVFKETRVMNYIK